MQSENLSKYNTVFKKVFNVQDNVLGPSFVQGNVESWDSIAHLSLVTSLEEEFNIMFDTEDILGLNSYEKGKEVLSKFDVSL
jgi:acyl carrier protein